MLGVAPDAAPEDVRRAFVARVRALHPDLVGPHPRAAEEIGAVVAARDALLGRGGRPTAAGPAPAGRGGQTAAGHPPTDGPAPPPPPGYGGPTIAPPPPWGGMRPVVLVALGRAARRFVHTWRSYDRPAPPH
jgi:hypothetical protein